LIADVCHHFSVFVHRDISVCMATALRIPRLVIAMILLGGTETIAQTVFFLFARLILW
jgi:hypothetical protein